MTDDATDTLKFFTEWWKGIPGHLAVPVFTLPNRKTVPCVAPGKAAAYASLCAESQDVYFGVGLQDPKTKAGRGKASDVEGIVGLWADVDFGAEGHKKPHAPTLEDAVALVDAMPAPATVLVHSGHGLHAYWLFDAPLLFRNGAEDRGDGATLVAAWQETLRKLSEAKGWTLDATHDLARVLRVPGTVNRKSQPHVPVRILRAGGPRHRPDDLRRLSPATPLPCDMAHPEPPDVGSPKNAPKNGPAKPEGGEDWPETDIPNPTGDIAIVARIEASCANDRKFRLVWEKKRLDLDSASEYDLSIASTLLGAGWSEKDVAEAILLWRTNHNENPDKARRGDYVSRTIRKAKRGVESKAAVAAIKRKREDIEANGEKPGDKADLLGKIRKALEIPIKQVIQHGREKSIYSLVTDDGTNLLLGENPVVLNAKLFQRATADYTHKSIKIRQTEWEADKGPGDSLLFLAELVENAENTRVAIALGWLRGFLKNQTIYRGDNPKESIEQEQAFIRGDRVFFRGKNLVHHVNTKDLSQRWKPGEVYDAVREAGGVSKDEMGPQARGHKPICRRYWSIPKEAVEDVLVDDLEMEVRT